MNSDTYEWKQSLPKFAVDKVNCLEEKLKLLQIECHRKQTKIQNFESLYNEHHQIQIAKLQHKIVNYDLLNKNAEKRLENSLKYNENLKSNLAFIEQELNSMKNGIEKIECGISSKENHSNHHNLEDLINPLQAETFRQGDVDQELQSASEAFNSASGYHNSVRIHKSETVQETAKQSNCCLDCIEYESNITVLKEQLMESKLKFEELKKYFTVQFYQFETSQSQILTSLSNIVKDKEEKINEWKMKCESTDSSIDMSKDENMSLNDEECSVLFDDFLTTLKGELGKYMNTESLGANVPVPESKELKKDKSKCELKNLKIENLNLKRALEESANFLVSKNNMDELIINENNNTIAKIDEMVGKLIEKENDDLEKQKMKRDGAHIQQGSKVLDEVEGNDLLQSSDNYKNIIEMLALENKYLKIENNDLMSQMKNKKTKSKKIIRKLLDYKHCLSNITSLLLSLFNHVDVNDIEFKVALDGVYVQLKSAIFWQQEISVIASELAKHPELFQCFQDCFDKKLEEKKQMEHIMQDFVMSMQEEIKELSELCFFFFNGKGNKTDANVSENSTNFQCNPLLRELELSKNLLHAVSANIQGFVNEEILKNGNMLNKDILLENDLEKEILCDTSFEDDTEKIKSYENQVTLMHFDYKRLLKNHLELQIKYERLKEDLKNNAAIKFGSEDLFKSPLKLK